MKTFPQDRAAKRKMLLDSAAAIADTLKASGAKSEELGTLAPEAVAALRDSGMFRLKLCAEMGGAEADPVTEMLVLENLAYSDMTSGWCTMVGATAIASLGTFLTPAGLAHVFQNGSIPTASISFFPAGRAKRDGKGYRLSGRWRFNSGIRHAEWVVGGTMIEDAKPGEPAVMFSVFPAKDVTLYDNWGGVTGLRGTGSVDCSVENHYPAARTDFRLGPAASCTDPRRPGLPHSPVRLCREGARQCRRRRRATRARRTHQHRHQHPRHFPCLKA